jgi:hypothetical protein
MKIDAVLKNVLEKKKSRATLRRIIMDEYLKCRKMIKNGDIMTWQEKQIVHSGNHVPVFLCPQYYLATLILSLFSFFFHKVFQFFDFSQISPYACSYS